MQFKSYLNTVDLATSADSLQNTYRGYQLFINVLDNKKIYRYIYNRTNRCDRNTIAIWPKWPSEIASFHNYLCHDYSILIIK